MKEKVTGQLTKGLVGLAKKRDAKVISRYRPIHRAEFAGGARRRWRHHYSISKRHHRGRLAAD